MDGRKRVFANAHQRIGRVSNKPPLLATMCHMGKYLNAAAELITL